MSTEKTIDFGAVYFRYSAPAEQDWEKDYKRLRKMELHISDIGFPGQPLKLRREFLTGNRTIN